MQRSDLTELYRNGPEHVVNADRPVLMVGGARPLEAEATAVAGQRVQGIELGR